MNAKRERLSLDQPTCYLIIVPGVINKDWFGWTEGIEIDVARDELGDEISRLRGEFDQAGLQGVLRQLYSLGIPLQEVQWIKE